MHRPAGEGGRSLRSGHGAADRQSRSASRAAHVARLKRICDVDDEDLADMIRELRSYDPKPGCRYGGEPIAAVASRHLRRRRRGAGWAVEINAATLPRAAGQPRYYAEVSAGPAGQGEQGLAVGMLASANWLVKALDQRQRTIIKVRDARSCGSRRASSCNGVAHLRPLTLRAGRRGDRDARIDGQPRHLEQISQLRARPVRAEIFLHQRDPVAEGGDAVSAEAVKSRDPGADRRRGSERRSCRTTRWSSCSATRASTSPGAPSPNIARRSASAPRSSGRGRRRWRGRKPRGLPPDMRQRPGEQGSDCHPAPARSVQANRTASPRRRSATPATPNPPIISAQPGFGQVPCDEVGPDLATRLRGRMDVEIGPAIAECREECPFRTGAAVPAVGAQERRVPGSRGRQIELMVVAARHNAQRGKPVNDGSLRRHRRWVRAGLPVRT